MAAVGISLRAREKPTMIAKHPWWIALSQASQPPTGVFLLWVQIMALCQRSETAGEDLAIHIIHLWELLKDVVDEFDPVAVFRPPSSVGLKLSHLDLHNCGISRP
jgi:hypothetical protein